MLTIIRFLLATFCFVHACGCNFQSGKFVVSSDQGFEVAGGYARADLFLGHPISGPFDNEKVLLAVVSVSKGKEVARVDRSVSHSGDESAMRVALQGRASNTFAFGLMWNREHDFVVLKDQKFSRKDGIVFVIIERDKATPLISQLPIQSISNKPDELRESLRKGEFDHSVSLLIAEVLDEK